MSASQAKIEANRANAQLSTGPKSDEGKAKSSLNSVKTGLTGRTVLLTTDDAAAYQEHVARFVEKYQSDTDDERELTQQLADTEWRLLRIPTLEAGIYAIGRKQLAAQFEGEEKEVAASMLEAQIFITYQRQLNNLSIQENRLRRYFEKAETRLLELQKARKDKRSSELGEAVNIYTEAMKKGEFVDLKALGFDFEIEEMLERVAYNLARREHANHPITRAKEIFAELQAEEAEQKRVA